MIVLYFIGVAVLLIQLVASRAGTSLSQRLQRKRNLIYLVILILLGIIRLTGFDLYFAQALRSMIELYGWYDGRRYWQFALLTVALIPSLAFLLHEIRRIAGRSWWITLTSVGIFLLALIVSLTLISFHYTDLILQIRIGPISISRLLELLALTLVIAPQLPLRPQTAKI